MPDLEKLRDEAEEIYQACELEAGKGNMEVII